MEVDFPEQDASSTDEEDTVSSSVSDDGDSSEMNDEDCERRRVECMDEMTTLEKQFGDLKEQLYKERLCQVDIKLQEVIAACAQEYLEPLANLQENMQIRTKVGGIYQELCLESVKNKYDCEIQAACQHWESEKLLLFDTVHSDLEEKIRRLEEDRHSIDITSELWNDGLHSRKNKKKDPFCPVKKKKPVVSGPYIVYMLQDLDVLEDWTAIRKFCMHHRRRRRWGRTGSRLMSLPRLTDTTIWRGLRRADCSMTASGSAEDRPCVSTRRTNTLPVP
eukprot:XP_014061526.1 PREDICTED: breast cancer metastasis-suppressor 1-like protein-A isoform X1 [Salmo salar]